MTETQERALHACPTCGDLRVGRVQADWCCRDRAAQAWEQPEHVRGDAAKAGIRASLSRPAPTPEGVAGPPPKSPSGPEMAPHGVSIRTAPGGYCPPLVCYCHACPPRAAADVFPPVPADRYGSPEGHTRVGLPTGGMTRSSRTKGRR